jgi:signal transduction histidine kinase
MPEMRLELNLLKVARVLTVYWLVSWASIPLYFIVTTGGDTVLSVPHLAVLMGISTVVLILLVWTPAQQRLGRAFFPLVITLSSLPFLIERYWYLLIAAAPEATRVDFYRAFTLRLDFVVLVLLVAWQYRFRYVMLYVGLISVLDWGLNILPASQGLTPPADFPSRILSRAMLALLVGYVVTWLQHRQWQQQQALLEANRQQAEANTKLARYAATVEQLSISRERNRLARELHDTLAHSLSALSVQLEAVSSLWNVNAEAARQMLSRADETTRTGLTEARRSLQALRAAPLEEFGLALALRELAESAAKRADLVLELEAPELAVNLPSHVEQSIYRIAQEALENVVRHARAKHVTVKLLYSAKEIKLSVADDGIGFAVDRLNGSAHKFGIRGMRERALMLESELHLSSELQKGTQVCLTLRLNQPWMSKSLS